MLVVSSLAWIIAKITLICFRFTGNKTRMAAVKLIAPTWVSIDIPASPPPPWSMTATKRHKVYFYKTLFFPLCSCLIDGLEDREIYYKVPKETQYRLNVKLYPTAWGCDLGERREEPVSDYTTSMFCCSYTYIAISNISGILWN